MRNWTSVINDGVNSIASSNLFVKGTLSEKTPLIDQGGRHTKPLDAKQVPLNWSSRSR